MGDGKGTPETRVPQGTQRGANETAEDDRKSGRGGTGESESATRKKSRRSARTTEKREAMKQALEFTSRVSRDMSCPELEGKIVDLVTRRLCCECKESLPTTAAQSWDHRGAVQVRSAYSLTEARRKTLSSVLKSRLGTEAPIEFGVDLNLLAGLEILVGSYVLRANLRDELEYFSAMRNHE